MTVEEMDELMAEPTKAFPAATEGKGAQELAPKVLPDGTKEFALTVDELSWEVEPGKFVDAMAYNGQVPGPTVRVDPGDKVRFVVKNEMEESTAVHFHGVDIPNALDGVPDITQPPIKPGATYVYEWTTQDTPAVGMYHSHHNAQVQVPNGLFAAFLIGRVPTAGPAPDGRARDGAERRRHDRLQPQRQVLPGHRAVHGQGRRAVPAALHERGRAWPTRCTCTAAPARRRQGRVPAGPALPGGHRQRGPGERYTVLVDVKVPGVWAFHCHILPHAERSTGMFGMVTALIAE